MAEMNAQQRQEILQLLKQGNKIAAVKRYMEATGADLRTSKDFVDQLQQALETGETPNGNFSQQISKETLEQITSLLKEGNLIPAIKLYKAETGVGLRDAKMAVEAIAAEHGIECKTPGCAITAMLLFGVLTSSLLYLTC